MVYLRVLRWEDDPDYLCRLNGIPGVLIRKSRGQEKRYDNIRVREDVATKTKGRVRKRLEDTAVLV